MPALIADIQHHGSVSGASNGRAKNFDDVREAGTVKIDRRRT
jgi:hypothetical protein